MKKIKKGYVLKARAIEDSWIAHSSPVTREVFDYLIREAAFKPRKYGDYVLERGELFTTISKIREALHWRIGYRKEMYSERQIKAALQTLAKASTKVPTKVPTTVLTKVPRGTLIKVLNYALYQTSENYEGTYEGTYEGKTNVLSIIKERKELNKKERREQGTGNASTKETKTGEQKKAVRETVFLTKTEYGALVDQYGEQALETKLDQMDAYIGSTGKKYKSHFHAVRSWFLRDQQGRSSP